MSSIEPDKLTKEEKHIARIEKRIDKLLDKIHRCFDKQPVVVSPKLSLMLKGIGIDMPPTSPSVKSARRAKVKAVKL